MDNEKVGKDDSSHGSHQNEKKDSGPDVAEKGRRNVYDVGADSKDLNAIFENPLAAVEPEQLLKDVEDFCNRYGLTEHLDVVKKGALVEGLTEEEQEALHNEKARKWYVL